MSGGVTVSEFERGNTTSKFRQLVRVIPIAQTKIVQGIEVMLLSVEAYSDGFILIGCARLVSYTSSNRIRSMLLSGSTSSIRASSSSGRVYANDIFNSSSNEVFLRFIQAMTPAVEVGIELTIELEYLRRADFDGDEVSPPSRIDIIRGPWVFTVSIP
jgi:hypothetical protein